MMVPVETWEDLCREPEKKMPDHYIACYFLGRIDKSYNKKIEDFSKKKGLPVVMLFDITMPEYYTYDPAEVLFAIKNADYVLTDSFHGSVFSILFHKEFYVFARNEGGLNMNSRIETLLGKFNLKDRVFEGTPGEVADQKWYEIENILKNERDKTKTYIRNALNTD